MFSAKDLGREAIRVVMPDAEYSAASQCRYSPDYNGVVDYTYNGTQTFDYSGRPNDADAD